MITILCTCHGIQAYYYVSLPLYYLTVFLKYFSCFVLSSTYSIQIFGGHDDHDYLRKCVFWVLFGTDSNNCTFICCKSISHQDPPIIISCITILVTKIMSKIAFLQPFCPIDYNASSLVTVIRYMLILNSYKIIS